MARGKAQRKCVQAGKCCGNRANVTVATNRGGIRDVRLTLRHSHFIVGDASSAIRTDADGAVSGMGLAIVVGDLRRAALRVKPGNKGAQHGPVAVGINADA
jgi:hypothetical protein